MGKVRKGAELGMLMMAETGAGRWVGMVASVAMTGALEMGMKVAVGTEVGWRGII